MLTIYSCRLSSICLRREHDLNHMMTEEDHDELSHVEIFSLVAATLSDLIKVYNISICICISIVLQYV